MLTRGMTPRTDTEDAAVKALSPHHIIEWPNSTTASSGFAFTWPPPLSVESTTDLPVANHAAIRSALLPPFALFCARPVASRRAACARMSFALLRLTSMSSTKSDSAARLVLDMPSDDGIALRAAEMSDSALTHPSARIALM